MKNLYAVLFLVFCALTSNAQNVNFIDSNFKSFLVTQITVDIDNDESPDVSVDTNGDGEIQESEAQAVDNLVIYSFYNISDVTGIESFSNLKKLRCYVPIASSQVNALTNLETLELIFGIVGTSLTLSNMPHLKSINCRSNDIAQLNLSGLPSLEILQCSSNDLTALDCSGLPALKELHCGFSNIASLNVSGLTNLTTLDCTSNALTSLDLTTNVNLKELRNNYYQGTSIDLSHLTNLETLSMSWTPLTSLDLSQLISLKTLECGSSQMSVLDLSNLPALEYAYCGGGILTNVITTGSNNLQELSCTSNHITSLDVSNKPNLSRLSCSKNQMTTLNISGDTALTNLDCHENLLSNLDIANHVSLQSVNCSDNNLSALNISNLVNLTSLNCSDNTIAALDTTQLTLLTSLEFSNNLVESINTTQLTNLRKLVFTNNLFESIDTTNLNLATLLCANNNLSSLDVDHFTNLRSLNCSNNHIAELNMPTVTYYTSPTPRTSAKIYLRCENNLLTSLDFSPISCSYVYVYFAGNPNLTQVNIKNINTRYNVYSMENCPNLHYICMNDYNTVVSYGAVFSQIDPALLTNISINSYCSFNPGGTYNTITGTFALDVDNNGCDENDYHFPNAKIQIVSGTTTGATFANPLGKYSFFTRSGNFVVSPVFENPYFTVSPLSATLNFTESDGSTQTQDFCVIPNGVHNDVEIVLIPIDRARPGFNSHYKLIYKNKGNQTLSGSINLIFDDAILDFVTADPALANQTSNTLNWNYNTLIPFESREIDFTLNVNSPMETPAVNIGDVLNFNASINPISGDETMADNTFALAQTVFGSYDPNDKTCLEGNTMTPEMVGGYLHYLIRFQNSGTAAAENIVVKDIIDTTKFDITSLQLTSASHPQVTKITGNKVEFQFENINLPAEIDNEPASHGYIAFKIKTKANLTIGDSVENKANIYFDYNFPIETNTATSVVTPLLSNGTFENASVTIAPNPTKNLVHITSKGIITAVELFDAQGRVLETLMTNKEQVDFDLSQKANGVYFVKIYTVKGVKVEKVIKD